MSLSFDADDAADVPIRDASTVMLVRDGRAGLEVFMLRRNLNSDFVGGAYVFPGGAVDPGDSADRIDVLSEGRSDAKVSPLLGVASGGLAYWVAAIRESFEEAGFLLAYDRSGEIVALDDSVHSERFKEHRRAVDHGALGLVELCDREELRLAVDRMQYFSRWITPLGAPRRYDTRFFVAEAPAGQTPVHDERETIANLWIRPVEALERHEAGEFELIFPTMRSLEALDRFDTAASVVDHAAAVERVEPVLPTIRESDDGLRIVLPGDVQFDAATNRRIDD